MGQKCSSSPAPPPPAVSLVEEDHADRNGCLNLSAPQREIVEASVDARLLVLAGPGSGKTHVLVARMNHLLEEESLGAGQEILVLSFTRAVVAELRRRAAGDSGRSRFVRPTTFDSFATRLLATTPGLEDWDDWTSETY